MSINNKRSYTEYTVTQPTTDFAIGFDDFDEGGKDNILVTLHGVLVASLGYAAIRKNESTVSITPAITEGTVRLTRETDIDEPFHKFTAGALFSAKSMDENFQQVRHSQQEVRDGFVFLEYNTNGIVQESKVATAQAKAATVEATASAVRAETAADTAVQAVGSLQGVVNAATTATTNANAATATATTAASQATAATTSAQNAAQAATTAKQEAAAAAANANAATVDTLAATGRANEAADVVADLVVGKVRAQDVSTSDGSTQAIKNTEFRNELDALPFEGGVLADTFVTATANGTGAVARTQREVNADSVSVKAFGAKGDGVTDDTIAIQSAVDHVESLGGGTVEITDGTYMINADKTWSDTYNQWDVKTGGIRMKSNVHLVLSKGAVLKAIPTKANNYNIINFMGVANSSIKGGILHGERYEHLSGGVVGEWGYAVIIQGSTNIHVSDMITKEFYGDSIMVSPVYQGQPDIDGVRQFLHNSYIYITNVICDNNLRQGLSIEDGQFIYVDGCTFKNIIGTSPQFGVDIEPWGQYPYDYVTGNIYFNKCTFLNNQGAGLQAGGQGAIDGIYLKDCYFENNNLAGEFGAGQAGMYRPTEARTDTFVVDSCIFKKGKDSVNHQGVMIDNTSNCKIINNTFIDCNYRFGGAGFLRDILVQNNKIACSINSLDTHHDSPELDDNTYTGIVIDGNIYDYSKAQDKGLVYNTLPIRGIGTKFTNNTVIGMYKFGTYVGNAKFCEISNNTIINLGSGVFVHGDYNTVENNKIYNVALVEDSRQAISVRGKNANILYNVIQDVSPIAHNVLNPKTFENPFWVEYGGINGVYNGNIYPPNKVFANQNSYFGDIKIINDAFNIGAITPSYAPINMQFYNTTLKKLLYKQADGWYDAMGVLVP